MTKFENLSRNFQMAKSANQCVCNPKVNGFGCIKPASQCDQLDENPPASVQSYPQFRQPM